MADIWLLFSVCRLYYACLFLFFKQKTAYEVRISDWSSDVCSSDLVAASGCNARISVLAAASGTRAMSSPMTLPSRFILYLAPLTNGAVLEFSPESAMKKLLIAAALACAPLATFAADHYTLDPHHTFARFALSHFGFSTFHGQFNATSGTATLDLAKKGGGVDVSIVKIDLSEQIGRAHV